MNDEDIYSGEQGAATYDETTAELFDPAVVSTWRMGSRPIIAVMGP